ncbi:hypothetical protein [Cellulomonas iranensis]|uniref:hypothetical protein n=1 Tax=Cellulomonas iranensis TaxID=76862 RepID=UPI0013CF8036|nr:hypothetical protein [Cellulomonas iranensis]
MADVVVRLLSGVVVDAGSGALAVDVDGSRPPVWWPAGYIPQVADRVKVLLVDGAAVVLGPVIAGQRPLTGTVSGAPSSGTVPVTTAGGVVPCRYVGTAPAIGALVRLDWQSTTPWVWPSAAATVPTPDPVDPGAPPPPPSATSGTLTVAAADSGTWSSRGVWDSYYATHLTQGSYGGRSYAGAWFYGAAPRQAAGRTVTATRVRVGARRRMGSYNAALPLNLYLHTSPSRPGGDVTRVAGPHTVLLVPGAGPQWVDVPASWGQTLVDSGGGLGIAGGEYGGIDGVGSDAASGQVQIDWRA